MVPQWLHNRLLMSALSKRYFVHLSAQNVIIRNLQITRFAKPISCPTLSSICTSRWYSSDNKTKSDKVEVQNLETASQDAPSSKLSQRTRLKQAVRDYGATIVVFHVTISLASLGLAYIAISNGVDAVRLLTFIGFSESVISSKVAVGGSTFVIAYAVHKVFAPARIAITLSVAPFIVRYLRKINWLKPPKSKT